MDSWKALFSPRVLKRGKGCYEAGAVKQVMAAGRGVEAVVEGSEDYKVEIEVQDGEMVDIWCSCPYAEDGDRCKHMAAVLYKIERGNKGDSPDWMEKYYGEKQELKDVILSIPENEVRDFLFEMAVSNAQVKNFIMIRYAGGITERQMLRLKKEIKNIADAHSDCHGLVERNQVGDYAAAIVDFLHDNVRGMIEQGFTAEAFELTNAVLIQTENAVIDHSNGDITWIGDVCYEYWEDILGYCGKEEKKKMFDWFSEMYAAGEMSNETDCFFLDILVNKFSDEEQLSQTLAKLDEKIEQSDCRGSGSADHTFEIKILRRLEIMGDLRYTELERLEYRRRYWNFASVRRGQIAVYQRDRRIEEAIELLEESKKLDEKLPGLVEEYSRKLIELYHDMGKIDEYKKELTFFIFKCNPRQMDYVDKLKEICSKEEWQDYREKILKCESGRAIRYELMDKEGFHERLLEEILKEGNAYQLDRYEEVLKDKFPEQVRDGYVQYVEQQAEHTALRSRYIELIRYLKKIEEYPEGEEIAKKIIAEWKEKYYKRYAMMDELRKAGL